MKVTNNQNLREENELWSNPDYIKQRFNEVNNSMTKLETLITNGFDKIFLEIGKLRQDTKDGYVSYETYKSRILNTDKSFDDMNKRIEKLEGIFSRINWIIISTIMLALLGLIILQK